MHDSISSSAALTGRLGPSRQINRLKTLLSLALGIGVFGMSVQASTLDTTSAVPNDGVLLNFTGINWHTNGAGWVQGYDLTTVNTIGDTDLFTVTYQAFAASIQTSSPTPNLSVASPGTGVGSYELTTFQTLSEQATCANVGCSTVTLSTLAGSWDIYFDSTPDADQGAGTGFRNGVLILSGTWDSGSGTFSAPPIGTGNSQLTGAVTVTNAAYISPALPVTMLQLNSLSYPGASPPFFTRPAAFDGVSIAPTDLVVQVDPLQTFSAVPEPTSFALAFIGILAMGAAAKKLQSITSGSLVRSPGNVRTGRYGCRLFGV